MDTHGNLQILMDTYGTACAIGPKGKARTHCDVCDADFTVRVKLRRHIRSGPLKPAPATCWPAHPDDPQGIRVASVIEFSVCVSVCLSVCLFVLGKFSNFFLQYKDTDV